MFEENINKSRTINNTQLEFYMVFIAIFFFLIWYQFD